MLLLVATLLLTAFAVRFKTSGGGGVESNVERATPATVDAPTGPQPSFAPKRFACEIPPGSNANWSVDGDGLAELPESGACMFFGDPNWTDYDFSFDVQLLDGWGLRTHFRYQDEANNYSYVIGGLNNSVHSVESMSDGKFGYLAFWQFKQNKGDWYHVEVKVAAKKAIASLTATTSCRHSKLIGRSAGESAGVWIMAPLFVSATYLSRPPTGQSCWKACRSCRKPRPLRMKRRWRVTETAQGLDELECHAAPLSLEEAKRYQDRVRGH